MLDLKQSDLLKDGEQPMKLDESFVKLIIEISQCNRCGENFDDRDDCPSCEKEFAKKYDY